MTAIANLPDLRPSLLLDFANSGRVDPRIQCTRASAATCFGPDGKLRTVAANVPRIDYDPVTGKCLGLLVEEQRTNLVKRSNELSHADWVKTGLVGIDAPDTNLMTKLVATTENRTHELYSTTPSIGFADDTLLTISVEAKAGGSNFFWLRCVNKAGSFPSATFNLLTGAASLRGATSANMKSLGGGVYRCSATFNLGAGASPSAGRTVLALATGEGANAEVFAGDGVAGVWFRNVQTEVGTFPTSYIPTDASAVTRAADQYLVPSSYFLNDVEGTFVGKFVTYAPALSYNKTVFSLIESGVTNNISVVYSATNSVLASDIRAEGMFQHSTSSPVSQGEWYRRALTWKQGFARSATNGDLTGGQSSSVEVPKGLTTLFVGSRLGQNFLCGHLHSLVYFSKAVTNEQLQRISAL